MGTTPTSVNQTATTIDKVIQDAIFDVALGAFKTYAVAQLPFLGFPIISGIFSGVLNIIGGYVYTALSQIATFTVIDSQIGSEQAAYAASVVALTAAHATGDPAALTAAQAAFKSSLASLIHFDGSTA
jgi:hypothetical protein